MPKSPPLLPNQELVTSNKSLAEFNVSLEPTLKERKELLRELYVTQGEIFATFDGKKQTLEKNTGATSLDTILAILQSETATSDEASEDLAERFLDGSLPVEEFLAEFRAKRKQTHMQRIKSEKFQEMINKGVLSSTSPDEAAAPAPPPRHEPQQHYQPPSAQQPPQQPQNNLSSHWNQSSAGGRENPHLPSPSRAGPPTSMPYPAQPPAGYPAYGGAAAAPPGGGSYWGQPQPVMTGPPPTSNAPYPMSQAPPHQSGGPRGGWGQGRTPYQMPPYMAMPQPHMPGGGYR